MGKATKKAAVRKPPKPYPDFPLFPHATKRWAKKIKGRMCYFGPWDDAEAALQNYLDQRDDLHAGRVPQTAKPGETTMADLCNRYLTAKRHLLDTRELVAKSYRDYYRTCERLIKFFGRTRPVSSIAPDDFQRLRIEMATTYGPVTLSNGINRIRMVFTFAYDQALIDRPVRYGQSFDKPKKKVLREARRASGKRMFEADELRQILSLADPVMRAMVLLGLNGGLGQTDIANLPQSAIDLETAWLDYPRSKTGIDRRIPLWDETVEALREAIDLRPDANNSEDDGCVFITSFGNRWVRMSGHEAPESRTSIDAVAKQFGKLLKSFDIKGKGNFYTLRHVFQTIGGESKDPDAVSACMGHSDDSMAAVYRERISDERLQAVVNVVRTWLWPEGAATSA